MGRRNRAGRKSWETRLRWNTGIAQAVSTMSKNLGTESDGTFNQYDSSDWQITATLVSKPSKYFQMDFNEFYGAIVMWTERRYCGDNCAFEICDEGNNWGLSDVLKEILLSGAVIYTPKGTFELTHQ